MTIGIVGPAQSIEKIKALVEENELYVDILPLVYDTFSEALELVVKNEKRVDGILFLGQNPYRYVSNYHKPTVPWEYTPRNTISVLSALLKAVYYHGYDITRVSADGFSNKLLQNAYAEIGFSSDSITVYPLRLSVLEKDFIERVSAFHLDHYRSGRVSFCLTGVTHIQKTLAAQGVPIVGMVPNNDLIAQKINALRLHRQILLTEGSHVAITAVHIRYLNDYSIYAQNELQAIQMEMRVNETIYTFAQRLGAAVMKNGREYFYLCSSQAVVRQETDGFRRTLLLSLVLANSGVASAALGIGLGKDAFSSKTNADRALSKAMAYKRPCCFYIAENGQIVGPVLPELPVRNERMIDQNLFALSQLTGIGVPTLYNLEQALSRHHADAITSGELAELMGVTQRNANRLLAILEDAGCVQVVGKKPLKGAGRPSRVLRISLIARETP